MDVRYTVCDTKYKNTSVYLKDKSIKGAANKPRTKKAGGKPPQILPRKYVKKEIQVIHSESSLKSQSNNEYSIETTRSNKIKVQAPMSLGNFQNTSIDSAIRRASQE